MSLSEKAMNLKGYEVVDNSNFYSEEDVKEAVRELKEMITEEISKEGNPFQLVHKIDKRIDEIFGEKLI